MNPLVIDWQFALNSGEFEGSMTKAMRYVAAINPQASRKEFVAALVTEGLNPQTVARTSVTPTRGRLSTAPPVACIEFEFEEAGVKAMLKLNHTERGILIAALKEARTNWSKIAAEARTAGKSSEAERIATQSVQARDLCTRFEEEQS